MKILSGLLLSFLIACGHLGQKGDGGPVLISQIKSRHFDRVNIREQEGTYPLTKDLTPALLKFFEDAAMSKARYISHLTLTTYEGSRSCVIIVGSEEDLNAINTRDPPSDGPRRVNTDVLNSQEKIYESKAFCKVIGTGTKRDFVLIQARIYVPSEILNQSNLVE